MSRRKFVQIGTGFACAAVCSGLSALAGETVPPALEKKIQTHFDRFLKEFAPKLGGRELAYKLAMGEMFGKKMLVLNLHDRGKFFGQLAFEVNEDLKYEDFGGFRSRLSTTLVLNGILRK